MQALFQLVFALVAGIAAIVATIVVSTSRFELPLLIAGVGFAGMSGTLLVYSPIITASDRKSFSAISILISSLAGFGTGGVSFLISGYLLVGPSAFQAGPSTIRANIISPGGATIFGLVVGLIAGRAIRFITVTINSASGRVGTVGTLGAAIGYLDTSIQNKLFGPTLINFDGSVTAEWLPTKNSSDAENTRSVTLGKVQLQIFGGTSKAPAISDNASASSRSASVAHARLRVDGAESAREAKFSVTLRGYVGEVFPARLDIVAPTLGSSRIGEFVILRGAEGDVSSLAETSSVLIDVSQSGTTIQLFELTLPVSPNTAGS